MNDVRTVRLAEGPVIADVVVPPSKSIANRALVCAALAVGESGRLNHVGRVVNEADFDDGSSVDRHRQRGGAREDRIIS